MNIAEVLDHEDENALRRALLFLELIRGGYFDLDFAFHDDVE